MELNVKIRKIKKKVEKLLFGAFLLGSPKCIFNSENKEIFYDDDGSKLDDDDYDTNNIKVYQGILGYIRVY